MTNGMMKFDGRDLFGPGEHKLWAMSWRRERVDRGFAGLDGVLSVDLGRRERKLQQRGFLVARNIAALKEMLGEISAYIDGQDYELISWHGFRYEHVRMDVFTVTGPISKGSQASCEYEIHYTQLGE